ncbi:vascular endothelial growth factor A-like [Hetaerina americana]|uniref:vascular endothelial growth factor A-like n=1 Tax=Hetaerina americana TaxID=62018 RepID=UPI003A7F5E44
MRKWKSYKTFGAPRCRSLKQCVHRDSSGVLRANSTAMESIVIIILALSFFACFTDAGSIAGDRHKDSQNSCALAHEYWKESYCTPRPTLVPLRTYPEEVISPTMAVVRLCGGGCEHAGFTCVPTATEVKKITVMSSLMNCTTRIALEHTACRCQCTLKCGANKYLNKEECICPCRDRSAWKACNANSAMRWDPMECTCKCANENHCPRGEERSKEDCRCVKKIVEDEDDYADK